MKTKRLWALITAVIMLMSLCACGSTPLAETSAPAESSAPAETEVESAESVAEVEEITVTDMIGRELSITPGSYERVVCIGAGALRMYSYVGDVGILAGVEDIDNLTLEERPKMFDSVARPYVLAFADVFATLPSCGVGGPMAQTAEAEKILSCDPDIVISEYEDVEKADALQAQLGVPVVTLGAGPRGVFDERFYGSMELLGKVFAREDRAEEIVSFVRAEEKAISERVEGVPEEEKPSVYICGLGNWGTTNHLMTAERYVSFEIAGVKNVLSGLGIQGIGPIEEEKFTELGAEMDIMIMDAAAVKNIIPLLEEDEAIFDTCRAWQEGEVYLEMAYNAYYTNYEIALINTWFIAKTVYPELFEDIDIVAKTDEVTGLFLGRPLSDEIFACPSSFGGYGKIDIEAVFG